MGGLFSRVLAVAVTVGASAAVLLASDTVHLRYLGASGLSIRRGADHILTAPFFSNPGKWSVLFGRIETDEERFPADFGELAQDAAAVLVGHSHYDHLMDVPAVARRLPRTAVVYGNDTAAHILAAAKDFPLEVVGLDARAGDSTRPGEWISVRQGVRFMPLLSGHAPHIAGLRFYEGSYTEDLKELPRRAKGWRMGQPLSFVVDFLDPDQTVRFRLFYQDAAAPVPQGFPPPLADGKEFDLAILCVASFAQIDDHPEAILEALRPRAVLLTHWEDFSRPQSEPTLPVPRTDVPKFIERLEAALPPGTPHWMPEPGETVTINVSPRAPGSTSR